MNSKRRFLSFLWLSALAAVASASGWSREPKGTKPYLVYVGTYTTKQSSKGIYAYWFDAGTGKLKSAGLAAESTDPSFVAVHPTGKYLYAVNEVDEFGGQKSGAVSAFAIDHRNGALKLLNRVATRGGGPCHVSLDRTGKYVLVANYDGGSVASFPVHEDGSLGEGGGFVQHTGSSVNKERQEGSHAHWIGVSPDNRFVIEANLGLDEVPVFHFKASNGDLTPVEPFVKVHPGAGPRHFAFHPNGKFAYLLTEMENAVTVFSYKAANGSLSALQTISTLQRDYSGPKEAAELVVHPSGKFLYASNRAGVDTVTAFSIDRAKGTLKLIGEFPTMGKTPRNFAIDPTGRFLLAANQESGNIVVFRIDASTGRLTPTGEVVEVPAPVCIASVVR
jgi:6-phosphogluconolactonase